MDRVVEPELLDALGADDVQALGSRADLRRINFLMGNAGALLRLLHKGTTGRRVSCLVELGAGDGTLLLRLARRLAPEWREVRCVAVDQQPAFDATTRRGFSQIGWSIEVATMDAVEWLSEPRIPDDAVIVANLFLHHFSGGKLERLLQLISARSSLFVACEPRRAPLALFASRLLGLIGCNPVTRHDAVVSVRAGFAGTELSSLWPNPRVWTLEERKAGLFSHAFLARRKSP
jgi:hypothetical protein